MQWTYLASSHASAQLCKQAWLPSVRLAISLLFKALLETPHSCVDKWRESWQLRGQHALSNSGRTQQWNSPFWTLICKL